MTDETNDDPLRFWNAFETTDFTFTHKSDYGAKLTSINGIYQVKKMTEMFGPCGMGWGFEILQSQMDATGTLYARQWNPQANRPELALDDQNKPIKVGEGMLHTMHINLWYLLKGTFPISELVIQDGDFGTVEPPKPRFEIKGIGHTPYIFMGQRDMFPQTDMDYEKKSLTDAITNAMAKLGMSADVRMGLFDIPDYLQERKDEAMIEHSDDAEAESARQRHEYEDWFSGHMELIKSAVTIRELEVLFKGARPRIQRQGSPEDLAAHQDEKNVRFRDLKPKEEVKA